MPRFNSRTGVFMGAVRSNYRSHFNTKCGHEDDENTGDKYPSPSDENSDEHPQEQNDYYDKPRQRPRPYYTSKDVLSLPKTYGHKNTVTEKNMSRKPCEN